MDLTTAYRQQKSFVQNDPTTLTFVRAGRGERWHQCEHARALMRGNLSLWLVQGRGNTAWRRALTATACPGPIAPALLAGRSPAANSKVRDHLQAAFHRFERGKVTAHNARQ
jgi:hypothetical protein